MLLSGAVVTVQIAACACLIGLSLGTILALIQTSSHRVLKACAHGYVTLIRGTPMLIQIVFLYYAILPALGINLIPLWAAIVAIGLNSSAYISQVIKSGIVSVGKGQREAAHTLGLSTGQTLRYIVLPQAIRVVIPSLGNEFITLIKDSSLAYTIGVVELYKQGITMRSQTFDTMTTFTAVALTYLILTTGLSLVMASLEKRMNRHVTH